MCLASVQGGPDLDSVSEGVIDNTDAAEFDKRYDGWKDPPKKPAKFSARAVNHRGEAKQSSSPGRRRSRAR